MQNTGFSWVRPCALDVFAFQSSGLFNQGGRIRQPYLSSITPLDSTSIFPSMNLFRKGIEALSKENGVNLSKRITSIFDAPSRTANFLGQQIFGLADTGLYQEQNQEKFNGETVDFPYESSLPDVYLEKVKHYKIELLKQFSAGGLAWEQISENETFKCLLVDFLYRVLDSSRQEIPFEKIEDQLDLSALESSGFGFKLISGQKSGLRALVLWNTEGDASIVFRGSSQLNDWIENFNFRQTEDESGIKTHFGFRNLLNEVWGDLLETLELETIESRAENIKHINLIGHSMGGNLATLAGYRLSKLTQAKIDVTTYGMPEGFPDSAWNDIEERVGVTNYAHDFDPVPKGHIDFLGFSGHAKEAISDPEPVYHSIEAHIEAHSISSYLFALYYQTP